ncbi:MAG: phosphomannomutase/phosphoglucomutase [Patescibacteria group bacterium]|nr:phosphomannomutase/phosphoglucomutase [Patescibacteria group bacterium]
MQVDANIFRAYDIRGVVGQNLDGHVAEAFGQSLGTWLRRNIHGKSQDYKPSVAIGRDNRFSSDELTAKAVEGLLAAGCEVTDIGLAVTPLVHFATINYSFDAGIIVTASHNPKNFNGFRVDLKNAEPFYNHQIQELKEIIENEDFEHGIGHVSYKEDVFNDYCREVRSRIKIERPLKVVLDCANGASSKFAESLFKFVGLSPLTLFCNLDGDFPYHQPDPEERINLQTLRLLVMEQKADLGFGFDTDADRYGVVDEKGTPYENDKMMIVLAREILAKHPASPILYDIKSSYVLPNEIKKAGGVPLIMKTGHPYYRAYMRDHPDIFLGGELSSHTFIKDDYYGYDDGLFAALRICQAVSRSNIPLSRHFADIPHTAHTEEIKIVCADEEKLSIVNEVGREFFDANYSVSDVDGYRVDVSQNSWFLIRASNTSPYLSLRFEAENKEELLKLVETVKVKLSRYKDLDLIGLGPKLGEKTHNV